MLKCGQVGLYILELELEGLAYGLDVLGEGKMRNQ